VSTPTATGLERTLDLVLLALDGDQVAVADVRARSAELDWKAIRPRVLKLRGSPAEAALRRLASGAVGTPGENQPEQSEPGTGRAALRLRRLLEGDPPTPPQLHTDDLLLAGDVNLFAGDGDAGKSTSLLSCSVATVISRPVFGSLTVKRPGPVVLLLPEDGEAVARHHVDALIAGLDPPVTAAERARLIRDLHIVEDTGPISLLRQTGQLADLIAGVGAVLFIAEPLANLLGEESENDETVAQAVCDRLRRDIGRPLGTAIVLAGHLRKPGRDSAGSEGATSRHDIKGSGGWANHSRMVWLLSKAKGSDLITFRLVKSNRLRTGLEHQVTLSIEADPEDKAHWISARLTDANAGAKGPSQSFTPGVGRAINDNERRALGALDDHLEPGTRLSYSAWLKRAGFTSENTFKDVRGRLLKAGLAEAIPTGKKTRSGGTEYAYAITEGGRLALETGWNRD
jgi:hypothetical protein